MCLSGYTSAGEREAYIPQRVRGRRTYLRVCEGGMYLSGCVREACTSQGVTDGAYIPQGVTDGVRTYLRVVMRRMYLRVVMRRMYLSGCDRRCVHTSGC